MVKIIIWTKAADRTFDSITDYLEENVSFNAAQNFAKLVYSKIDSLVKYPTLGRRVMSTKSVRVVNMGKNHQLYYRVEGKTLYISNFFDTRRDPDKRPFK
jgi:plasmid stabilization system protein ParE